MSFSAAHSLRQYDGPCENMHGHNWLVRAVIRCEQLNDLGIGIDFKELRSALRDILSRLDHRDLNDVFDADRGNPSSENIARYIYEELKPRVSNEKRWLYRVEVFETPGNCAAYFEHA
jgi:6-pyruvoyltetrahydropterin/6-carboxytetrahydropterin synthase